MAFFVDPSFFIVLFVSVVVAAVLGLILSQYKQQAAFGAEPKKTEAEPGKIAVKLKNFWKNLF